jgi:hypothetical protein
MADDVNSWESVVEFFDGLAAKNEHFVPMQSLSHGIANSEYASALYPWTSMQAFTRPD